MESQPNFETQNLNQNPYKILFFVSLGLFLVIISVLTTLLITQKSSNPTKTVPTNIEETDLTPTETVESEAESITPIPTELTITPIKPATSKNSSKTFKIADLIFTTPNNWTLISAEKDIKYSNEKYTYYTAKFLTDYKSYTVYALADIQISNVDKNEYLCDTHNPIKTQFGQVCELDGSGYGHFYINLNNGSNYYISWGIESNQSPPENLDGVWRPDNNLTDEIMMNFAKSAKVINK